jgi:hypothetical protein
MSSALFSTGTARGGTTFFARILSVNKEVKVTNDPFLPVFRSLRTEILRRKIDPEFNAALPLDDYYFSENKLLMMKAIQNTDLDLIFPEEQRSTLQAQLISRVPLGAKELLPFIDELKGDTYLELFQDGLRLLEKAHKASEAAWCGFNDNWIIEFFPLLAKSFPDAKFFVIIRDPRGTMASSLKLREKEPEMVPLMYSFAHHWRKHVAFARMLIKHPMMKGRLFIVRYEDLVNEPEKMVNRLCEFLNVKFDMAMLDTEKFRPFRGDKWTPWSNFKVPEKGIYTDAVMSWKKYLNKGTIEFIEFICDPEMRLFNYTPEVYGGGLPSVEVMRFLKDDDKIAVGWRGTHMNWDIEHGYELFRKQALKIGKELLTPGMIEKNFLFESVYDEISSLL